MKKRIILTGATDGIGFATAKMLASKDHHLILHGRNKTKMAQCIKELRNVNENLTIDAYIADLSQLDQVKQMAQAIKNTFDYFDVLINNAGVFTTKDKLAKGGRDLRFEVNTIAPYLLTIDLLPTLSEYGRVVNLSSAAQEPINFEALEQGKALDDYSAYAQSKLAIGMWSQYLGEKLVAEGGKQVIVSLNPKSFLGSKMVKEAYGKEGHDLAIGAEILCRAALSEDFEGASGKYYDNDHERFALLHPFASHRPHQERLMGILDGIIK